MLSLLRLIGLAVGIAIFGMALWHRRRGASRALFLLELLGASGVILTALFPDWVEALRFAAGIGDQPLSRLVTLLVITTGLLFGLVLYALARAERASARVSRLVRSLAAAQFPDEHAAGLQGGILICIPAYNEALSLPAVLAEIPAVICGLHTRVLVIDDASTDKTRSVAQAHGADVVTQPLNGGTGAALQTGYLLAERLGAEIVVTLDADGQHVPSEMEALVQPIVDDQADFVIGSRRKGSYEREVGADGVARHLGITLFSRLANVLGGTRLSDVSNGFRAIRVSRLPEIVFTEDQFHNPELVMGAARSGLRIIEVPVTIRRRTAGYSKKGGTLHYGFGFLRVLVRSWLRDTARPSGTSKAENRGSAEASVSGRPN